jgi:hypothetical protein
MKKTQINLKIKNNTAFNQAISLFNIVANPNSASQTVTEYVYDLTGHVFLDTNIGLTYLNLQTLVINNVFPIVYSGGIQGVVNELNILTSGQGLWRYEGDFIYFNSDIIEPFGLQVD